MSKTYNLQISEQAFVMLDAMLSNVVVDRNGLGPFNELCDWVDGQKQSPQRNAEPINGNNRIKQT